MQLLYQFGLSPHRTYKVSKKSKGDIAVFSEKVAASYLDYSVDFSNCFTTTGERIISGGVTLTGKGLSIEAVVAKDQYLTAFIDGGISNHSYYLTFEAQTNQGGFYIQPMILAVTGKNKTKNNPYSFLAFSEMIKPPDSKPPLNTIRINNRYLLNDSGFFMVM